MAPATSPLSTLVDEVADVLTDISFEDASLRDSLWMAGEADRLISLATGLKARALAAAAACEPRVVGGTNVFEEWRLAGGLTLAQAGREIADAIVKVDDLPAVHEGLASGTLTTRCADAIVRTLRPLVDAEDETSHAAARALSVRAVEHADRSNSVELKRLIERWMLTKDPRSAQTRHEEALRYVDVTHTVLGDGIGRLSITGRVDLTLRAFKAIDATAKHAATHRDPDDERRIGQRRSEIVLDVLLDAAAPSVIDLDSLDLAVPPVTLEPADAVPAFVPGTSLRRAQSIYSGVQAPYGWDEPETRHLHDYDPEWDPPDPGPDEDDPPPRHRGPGVRGKLCATGTAPVQVVVTCDLPTVLGIASHPALLDGSIPITAQHARRMFDVADFTRLLLEPNTGELLDASPHVYRPNRATADYVCKRDPVCRAPGCLRPVSLCQIDHQVPFNHDDPAAGGATVRSNLGPLCLTEHQLKTLGGFNIEVIDGVAHWTTPLGQKVPIVPFDHRPTGGESGPPDRSKGVA